MIPPSLVLCRSTRISLGLQIAQNRSYLYTLGPKVGIIYILGDLGYGTPHLYAVFGTLRSASRGIERTLGSSSVAGLAVAARLPFELVGVAYRAEGQHEAA